MLLFARSRRSLSNCQSREACDSAFDQKLGNARDACRARLDSAGLSLSPLEKAKSRDDADGKRGRDADGKCRGSVDSSSKLANVANDVDAKDDDDPRNNDDVEDEEDSEGEDPCDEPRCLTEVASAEVI